MNYLRQVVLGSSNRVDLLLFRTLLLFPALVYYCIMVIRNILYNHKLLPIDQVITPVISIGNITVGGTGKTPFALFLARLLQQAEKKIVVVSRGYKRYSTNTLVVADETGVKSDANTSGDEPYLMAQKLPHTPIIVDKNRARAACYAEDTFKPDFIILDDGFQHRRLNRNTDIVVIDATNPFGNGSLLPAGILREPLSALRRADLIVLAKTNQNQDISHLNQVLSRYCPHTPRATTTYTVENIYEFSNKENMDPASLSGKRALIFAGIGNPGSFYNTAQDLSVTIAHKHMFNDHHWYTAKDIGIIAAEVKVHGLDCIITTEKDAVRLPSLSVFFVPCYVLEMKVTVTHGLENITNMLEIA